MARALQEVYNVTYQPKFSQAINPLPLTDATASLYNTAELSQSMAKVNTEPSNQSIGSISLSQADGLIVMTENAESFSLAGFDVTFQHQIHEIEKQKKDGKNTKRSARRKSENQLISD